MTKENVLIIAATDAQLDHLVAFGNGRALVVDSTHGTNVYGIPLAAMHVIDDHGHGRCVGFAFMQPEDQANHAALMTALRDEAVAKDRSWTGPSCVLTDKCDAEINAAGCDHSS
jgi:MULE transposase domain